LNELVPKRQSATGADQSYLMSSGQQACATTGEGALKRAPVPQRKGGASRGMTRGRRGARPGVECRPPVRKSEAERRRAPPPRPKMVVSEDDREARGGGTGGGV